MDLAVKFGLQWLAILCKFGPRDFELRVCAALVGVFAELNRKAFLVWLNLIHCSNRKILFYKLLFTRITEIKIERILVQNSDCDRFAQIERDFEIAKLLLGD